MNLNIVFFTFAGLYLFLFFGTFTKISYLYGLPYFDTWSLIVLGGIFLLSNGISALLIYFSYYELYYSSTILIACLSIFLISQPILNGRALPEVEASASSDKPNIIFISLCTFAANHLSLYGYDRPTSPNLKQFSKEAIVFNRAFSAAPWTRPSFASIFTGVHPDIHNTYRITNKLPNSLSTFPERLYKNGYRTAGFITNPNVSSYFGFNRGFERYHGRQQPAIRESLLALVLGKIQISDMSLRKFGVWLEPDLIALKNAKEVNTLAKKWLVNYSDQRKPFFMFLQYMDAHDPYDPPKNHLSHRNLKSDKQFTHPPSKNPNDGVFPFYTQPEPTESLLNQLIYQYDAEIRYWDYHFGKLIDFLKNKNHLDNTWVFITGDHGEEFHQHGHWKHANSVFNELIHVPLVIRPPSDRSVSSKRINLPVSNVDLSPTVLEIANVSSNTKNQGKSLKPLIKGKKQAKIKKIKNRAIIASDPGSLGKATSLYTMINDPFKIHRIRKGSQQSWLFYNLQTDFSEQNNIASDRVEKFKSMKSRLTDWINSNRIKGKKATETELTGNIREDLKGLGYID